MRVRSVADATIIGATDGSITSLTPVEENVFKRLQLLQGQLTRSVQHTAGLNPKAFRYEQPNISATPSNVFIYRIVRNDYVSKPLSKGILDGNLLTAFEMLPIRGQSETTRLIGTDRAIVLKDLISFGGAW